jgi:hypothetical protein
VGEFKTEVIFMGLFGFFKSNHKSVEHEPKLQTPEYTKIVTGQMGKYEAQIQFHPGDGDYEPKVIVRLYNLEGEKMHERTSYPNNWGEKFSLRLATELAVQEYEEKHMTGRFELKLDEFNSWDGEVK